VSDTKVLVLIDVMHVLARGRRASVSDPRGASERLDKIEAANKPTVNIKLGIVCTL
jgi:hypothetical protein